MLRHKQTLEIEGGEGRGGEGSEEETTLEIATSETKGTKQEQKEFIEELSVFFFFSFFPFRGEISSLPWTLGAAESSLLLPTDGATQSSLPVAQGIRKYFITFYGHDLRLYYMLQKFLLVNLF